MAETIALGGWWIGHHQAEHAASSNQPKQPPGDSNMGGMQMGGMKMGGADMGSAVKQHAALEIAPEVQQRIGVTTARAERAPLDLTIRTVGIIRADETKISHVQIKTEGWVEKLYVDYTGQRVKKGSRLLSIYSPDFLTTQIDYLRAHRYAAASGAQPVTAQTSLAQAARERLALWDVPPDEIAELERTQRPQKALTLRSLIDGTVLEKKAFAGQHVTPNEELYVIADLSTVWVQAKIYERELPNVKVGQVATVQVPAIPNRKLTGKIVFIDPVVEETARTVQVRIELPNRDDALRPSMFANVELTHAAGEALLVPTSAVIRTGEMDIVYRVENDRFVPVEVKIAPEQYGDKFRILSGLSADDVVVTSANFLIDSESRLRAGGGNMAGMSGMDMPGMEKGSGGMKGMKEMKGGEMKGMQMPQHEEGKNMKQDGQK